MALLLLFPEAQSKLVSCFDAARSAEAAGANISQLTHTLNVAGSLLSNAQLAYSKAIWGGSEFSVQSQNQLSNFISNANSLRVSGFAESNCEFSCQYCWFDCWNFGCVCWELFCCGDF